MQCILQVSKLAVELCFEKKKKKTGRETLETSMEIQGVKSIFITIIFLEHVKNDSAVIFLTKTLNTQRRFSYKIISCSCFKAEHSVDNYLTVN